MNILIVLGIILLSIIGLILLLLLLILLPYTCVGIEYLNAAGQQKLVFLLFLFGKRVQIPLQILPKKKTKKIKKEKKKPPKKKDQKTENKKPQDFKFSDFKEQVDTIIKLYNAMSGNIKSSISYIVKKTDFDDVRFYTNFGFKSPMETGIMTGTVWGVVNLVLAYLNNVFGISKVELIVNPVYTKECFDVYFYCIIKLRLVHIITAAVNITKGYLKYQKENKK